MKLRKRTLKYAIGTQIDKLTIVDYNFDKCYYTFRCECGSTFIGTTSTIKQKTEQFLELGTAGCKLCVNKVRRTNLPKVKYYRAILNDYKRNAYDRNYSFDLTDEECINLFESPCHYCGTLNSNSAKVGKLIINYNGIDRMNNSLGYTPTNVVSCCKQCNYAKNKYDYNEFIEHIEKIYKHLQRSGRHAVESSDSKWRTPNLQAEEGDDMI